MPPGEIPTSAPGERYRLTALPTGRIVLWAEDCIGREAARLFYRCAEKALQRAESQLGETLDPSHRVHVVTEVAPFPGGACYPEGIILQYVNPEILGSGRAGVHEDERMIHEFLHYLALHCLSHETRPPEDLAFLIEGLPLATCALHNSSELRLMHLVAKGGLSSSVALGGEREPHKVSSYELDGSLAAYIAERHGLGALKELYRGLASNGRGTAVTWTQPDARLDSIRRDWRRFLRAWCREGQNRAVLMFRAACLLGHTLERPIVARGNQWYRNGEIGLRAEPVQRTLRRAFDAYTRLSRTSETAEDVLGEFHDLVAELEMCLDRWEEAKRLSAVAADLIVRRNEPERARALLSKAYGAAIRVSDSFLVEKLVNMTAILISLGRYGLVTDDACLVEALREEAESKLREQVS